MPNSQIDTHQAFWQDDLPTALPRITDAQLDTLLSNNSTLEQTVQEQQTTIAEQQTAAANLQSTISDQQQTLQEQQTTIAEQQTLIDAQNTAFSALVSELRAAFGEEYRTGRENLAKTIVRLGGEAHKDMSLQEFADAVLQLQGILPTRVEIQNFSWPSGELYPICNISWLAKVHTQSWHGEFQNYSYLKVFTTGGKYIDTSSVTTVQGMFNGCSQLQQVDLRGLDFSSVTTVQYMFSGCSQLQQVDLRGLDFSSVTTVARMFYYCSQLQSLVGGKSYEEVVEQNIQVFAGLNVNTGGFFENSADHASLRAIINGVQDRTGKTALTLTFGRQLKAKLTADDIAIATGKNWNIA